VLKYFDIFTEKVGTRYPLIRNKINFWLKLHKNEIWLKIKKLVDQRIEEKKINTDLKE
jgi:hypothetical protein